jgi:hypothetical protein
VAGESALVIQAYRRTHGGATPSPALVRQIVTSTATDLGAPAEEQGAGLMNSYKAVLLAESIRTSDGSPAPAGRTLLVSPNQLNAVAAPGTPERWNVTVTNTGAQRQSVDLRGRTFGPERNVQTGSVTLNDATSPHFTDFAGVQNNYGEFHFYVPRGQDRLTGELAWPGDPSNCLPPNFCTTGLNARVRMILIDPQGRFAAHSLPQGPGNFGTVEVRFPASGTWTGVIFGDQAAAGGTNGTIPWRVATQQFAPFGSVTPRTLQLAPGETRTVSVSAVTPSDPGDASGSIVLASDRAQPTSIPVTLRSRIEVRAGGTFSGVLTGGNGRPLGNGQQQYYEFNVPPGVRDITADVRFANDPADPVGSYLISPDGDTVGYGQNSAAGSSFNALTAYTLNPVPGTWTLIVDFAEPVVGNEISQPYVGRIRFNAVDVRASGVPNDARTKLTAGQPLNARIIIHNTSAAPEAFFVDPRLDGKTTLTLTSPDPTNTLPLTTQVPEWLVPTQTSSVDVGQVSSLPAMFDVAPSSPYIQDIGDPDIASAGFGPGPMCALSESASYTPPGGTVTAGVWAAGPTECGPYATPAPKGTVTNQMTAQTKPFDTTVSSDTGDMWLQSVDPTATVSPVVIGPGQTGVINVTFTPAGASGTVVNGTLYVDDLTDGVPPYYQFTGDELAAIRYSYTIR